MTNIMKIGNIYIKRATTVKDALIRNKHLDKDIHWNRLFGVYHSRIFGICVYRVASSQEKI